MGSKLRWLALIPTVTGSFFLTGIAAGLAADILGLWYEPIVGFVCASVVVLVAFLVSPSHKMASATGFLVVGAVAAWWIIRPPSWYPATYEARAYQSTYMPVMLTYAGGAVGWIGCWFCARRR